jgi:RND superfamily putative drug exporter
VLVVVTNHEGPVAAVRRGVASTARIITGAALIIVAVFSGFARGDLVMFQQTGLRHRHRPAARRHRHPLRRTAQRDGPARRRSWYLPRWLGWIPHLEVEGEIAPQPQPRSVAAGFGGAEQ